jgi:ankyrin repeat protein
MANNDGKNALHMAAVGGDKECIEWVLATTSIDVNSVTSNGTNSIARALLKGHVDAAIYLVERGSNLFIKNSNGVRAIDTAVFDAETDGDEGVVAEVLGPQVLQHAIDLRWASVMPLLLLFKTCSSTHNSITSPTISVFMNFGLIRDWIAPFLLRTDIIVRDLSIPHPPKEPDAVKRRVEATLLSERNKRARK